MASQIDENLLEREVEREEEGLQVREAEPPPLLGACQNPMLIDGILSNLFGFLDFKGLGKCRRVSKQWFKVSLPVWLDKAPEIKLYLTPNTIRPLWYRPVNVDVTTIDAFLRLVHKEDFMVRSEFHSYGPYEYAGLRQYKKFALTGSADEPVEHQALQQFLRLCGHAVAELTLELRDTAGALVFPIYQAVLLSTMTPNMVKLRIRSRVNFPAEDLVEHRPYAIMQEAQLKLTSLHIEEFGCLADDWSKLPVAGWIQLLKRYPSLKTLILSNEALPKLLSGPEEGLILPTLSKLHCDYGKRHILWDPLGPEAVRKLTRIFPNMKDLQLWLNNLTLQAVVQSLPGLQRLTIIGNGVDDDGITRIVSDLPRMQDLKYLTMKHYDDSFQNCVGPVGITDKSLAKFLGLPNLERLQVTLDPRQVYPDSQILRTVEEGIKTFTLTLAMKLYSWDWEPEWELDTHCVLDL